MVSRWKVLFATLGVSLVLTTVVAVAFAAKPNQAKGASYTGHIASHGGIAIGFKVSSDGRQVTQLRISNTPLFCSGGGRATPVRFKNASISSKGAFTSSGQYVITEGRLKGKVGSKLKITGRFLKGKVEQGTLTTTYVGAPQCGGKSPYTTKA